MGCFTVFPCFTSSKHSTQTKSINKTTSSSSANQGYVKNCKIVLIKTPTEESTHIGSVRTSVSRSRDNSEDKEICKDDKEKNVKEGSGKLGDLVQRDSAKERDDEKNNENGILGVLVQIETETERMVDKDESDEHGTVSDSSVSSYICYPPMHRYYNCEADEYEEQHLLVQEGSPESFFSLSIDPTRQSKSSTGEVDDKEVNSPLKRCSSSELNENSHNESVDYLLNPIENLVQRKTTKARPMLGLDHLQEKENLYIEQGKVKTDAVVATSLSSWLVDPEKSTVSNDESQYSRGSDGATSWKSCEDRPILGAWSIDEVRQISARSSPRKSPCHNPDDTLIIGTVGSYWSHTGQTTDSSYSCTSPLGMSASAKSVRNIKNKALSCHSSSKRRLERAFDKRVD